MEKSENKARGCNVQLRNINHTYYIKDEDTATKIKLQVLDYENQPFDLKSAEKVEVIIGINEGRLLTKEPDLLDETGVLEFRIDEDDVLVVGKNLVEVHITTIDGRLQKAPSKGYYELILSRSIDTLGANVTKITLQRLLDEVEETKQDLTDEVENAIGYVDAKISQMQSDVQDAVQYTSETVNQVRQEFNEQLDTTVSNKMTPFVKSRFQQGVATITSVNSNGYFRSDDPFVTVSIDEFPQNNAPNYDVVLTPISGDTGLIGNLEAYDKTQNGFKVRMTGSAKSVTFLWTILNPNV